MKQKVYAYITRERMGRTEVLVFSYAHEPESGTQVPGGSLEPGENPNESALREVRAEVRCANPSIISHVGSFVWYCEPEGRYHLRHVYHVDAGTDLPDSFETRGLSGDEDNGWLFRWRWMDAAEAAVSLFGDQGHYLPQLTGDRRTCPCCGYVSLEQPYAVCPICYWQDHPGRTQPYHPVGRISLYEAQRNYLASGAFAAWARPFVRKPGAGDRRDRAWVAVPPPTDLIFRSFACPACGHENQIDISPMCAARMTSAWEPVECAGCGRHGQAVLRVTAVPTGLSEAPAALAAGPFLVHWQCDTCTVGGNATAPDDSLSICFRCGAQHQITVAVEVTYPPDPTVTCPCCGYVTLNEADAWEICPICFWEDEDVQGDPDCVTGANRLSLRQAQRNFARFGACDERSLRFVRPVTPHDRRDPDWRPADQRPLRRPYPPK